MSKTAYILLAFSTFVLLAIFGSAYTLLPPDRLVIAAGSPGSAYYQVAERYQWILARDGIRLDIRETAGSADNADLLAEGRVDVAILQGGVPVADGGQKVEALAGLFSEALLLFHTGALERVTTPASWRGLRFAAGGDGSGTKAEFDRLAPVVGFDETSNTLLPLGGADAAAALLDGTADAAMFVAPLDAPYLDALFESDRVQVAEPVDPEALISFFPHLVLQTLPRGAIDYARRVPDRALNLLTTPARLIARDNLHPALVNRLIHAAREVHSSRGLLRREGEFPSTEALGAPIDAYARTLIHDGPSPLAEFLPYWVVAQINRFALLLLPVLFLLPPLVQAIPSVYAWQMRSRIYRNYMDLREIDLAAETAEDPDDRHTLSVRLDELEHRMRETQVPPAYRGNAYLMRQHIDLVRRRLADPDSASAASDAKSLEGSTARF